MLTKDVKKIIKQKFPSAYLSAKKGGFVFKQNYYWGVTKSSEPFANRIVEELKSLGLNSEIVSHNNTYRPWPKDSYFEAVIKILVSE